MARDYARKNRKRRRSHRRYPDEPSLLAKLWLGIVLLGGALVAVWLLLPTEQRQRLPQLPAISAPDPNAAPTAAQFDFYHLLPEMRIAPAKPATPAAPAKPTAHYLLQLASFKHFSEADELKAKLTLMGFDIDIEQAHINGEHWFRVRSGPYDSPRAVELAQKRLATEHIDSFMIVSE